RQEVLAVQRHKVRVAACRKLRHGPAQRVVQPQADDVARPLLVRHRQAHLAGRLPDAFGDGAGRVDDRAVPVEDDERIPHASLSSMKLFISPGTSALKASAAPERGCLKDRLAACRNSRLTPCLASSWLSGKSPYLSSPSTGCPACARCTRIWCVRPVISRTS